MALFTSFSHKERILHLLLEIDLMLAAKRSKLIPLQPAVSHRVVEKISEPVEK